MPSEYAFFGLAEVIKSTWVQKQIKLQEEATNKKSRKNISTAVDNTGNMGRGASTNDESLNDNNDNDMDDEEKIDEDYWEKNEEEGMLPSVN